MARFIGTRHNNRFYGALYQNDVLNSSFTYQIVEHVEKLARSNGITIPPLGIVATKVQGNNLHRRVMDDLRHSRLGLFSKGTVAQPPLFNACISQAVDVARGADVDVDNRTFKGKYGAKAYGELQALTQEIIQLCEKKNS